MRNESFLIAFCFWISAAAFSQQVEITVAASYAGSNMSDLKTMNEDVINQIPFEVKLVEDFPPWFVYRASLATIFAEKYKIGVVYNHSSTGSRVSYADYSGEYHFDITAKGNSIGLLLGYNVFRYKNIEVQFDATLGVMLSTCNFSENLSVYAMQQSDNLSMESTSLVAIPELSVNYWLGIMGFGVFCGYQYDVGGPLNLSGQKTTISTNWSGFRVGAVLRVRFPKVGGKQDAKAQSNN